MHNDNISIIFTDHMLFSSMRQAVNRGVNHY